MPSGIYRESDLEGLVSLEQEVIINPNKKMEVKNLYIITSYCKLREVTNQRYL
tara:strand:- start:265 stop:423 length:159 start_codon:yes stop_codon:yes gene_type:complete